ncbi:hypothetical protein PENTCL1PPCAC_28837 [Pristionchus entomophagus]|uniref:Saposin B-type domain-containing protein n=1 Tax=Pristionchus entomophagus TaxID=358040 RepID=A0AAV5UIY7_9BILA|nr:hypothetical protein PENTCL1PPCAC_28837 [Pristionchus entomophagus]
MILILLLSIAVISPLSGQESSPISSRSQTCSKCVSVIDSYRFSHQLIESARRMRSELMGRCHRWSGGVITCRKAMSDQQNIRLLQASFMETNNNPHLSCIAIRMCTALDFDIYLRRDHSGEEFSHDLPVDFNQRLIDYYKKAIAVNETNGTSTIIEDLQGVSRTKAASGYEARLFYVLIMTVLKQLG